MLHGPRIVRSKPNNYLILVLESYRGAHRLVVAYCQGYPSQGGCHTYQHVTSKGVGYHVLWYDVIGNSCISFCSLLHFLLHFACTRVALRLMHSTYSSLEYPTPSVVATTSLLGL